MFFSEYIGQQEEWIQKLISNRKTQLERRKLANTYPTENPTHHINRWSQRTSNKWRRMNNSCRKWPSPHNRV